MIKRQKKYRRAIFSFPGLWGVVLCWMLCQTVSAETFLPEQDISLNGTVLVPSCKIRMDVENLMFSKEKAVDQASQRLSLRLSQCDIEGLNVMFRAATWSGYPDRGILKSRHTRQPSTNWHFRVAPERPQQKLSTASSDRPLSLAEKTSGLIKDTPIRNNPEGQYFSLDGIPYEYSTLNIQQGQGELMIPFVVSLHSTGSHSVNDDLDAAFAVQLTYR